MSLIDNPPARLRALIYNRVSSDPTGRSISVDSQDSENRAFCARQDWDVIGTVTDNDRSASRFATRERNGYAEIQRAIRAGELDVLVCWEASRADRDLAAYAKFRDLCVVSGVLWSYSGRVYDLSRTDDRFTTGLDSLLAEREAAVIRDRIKRGINTAAAGGRPHGTIPYGYRRDRDPRTGAIVAQIPDPMTAPIVRRIVARLLAGDALYSIAADLNRAGTPTPQGYKELAAGIDRGRLWSSATIRVLVASHSMTGVRTHNGVPHTEATWEPIVSMADWWRVQTLLADPARSRHHRGVTPRHLLAGIATCGADLGEPYGVCGAWLRAASNRGQDVYQCAGHGVGDPRGKGHVSRGPRTALDAMVETFVVRRLMDPDLLVDATRQQEGDQVRVSTAEQELADLRAIRAEYIALAKTPGGRSPAAALEIIADYDDQIEAAQARMGQVSGLPQVVLDVAGPDADTAWETARAAGDMVWMRSVVRGLVRVVVHRSARQRGDRGFDRSSVEITRRTL